MLSFGGFLPWRGRIAGRDGDGIGLLSRKSLAESTERKLYEVASGSEMKLGGVWRDESIILVVGDEYNRIWLLCARHSLACQPLR